MNVFDTLSKMVDHFPGGRAVMAVRLDVSDEVLRKKLAGSRNHNLSALEAVRISDLCIEAKSEHCYLYASLISASAGRLLALPVYEMTPKQDLRTDTAGMMKECADLLGEVTLALSDEQISDNELKRIEKEAAEAIEKLQAVLRGAQARNEANKPAYLRAA